MWFVDDKYIVQRNIEVNQKLGLGWMKFYFMWTQINASSCGRPPMCRGLNIICCFDTPIIFLYKLNVNSHLKEPPPVGSGHVGKGGVVSQ
jgi:hypothetical protein